MPVTIPHAAMHAPEEWVAPFRKKFPQFEDKIGKYRGPEVKNPIAAFAGMMTLMDHNVGQLMALLKELNLDDCTIVMLSSDNGPHLEGGHDPVFFNSNGPLKGHKRDLYEGGIRAPLIARWPGKISAGATSDHLSAHWDMLPTFCELAGVTEYPLEIDGISMVPELMSESDQEQHEYLYWEFYAQGGKRAVRFGDWKAVQLRVASADQTEGVELYNLSTDLGEETNVASEYPKQVELALKYFKAAHIGSEFWQFGGQRKQKKRAA